MEHDIGTQSTDQQKFAIINNAHATGTKEIVSLLKTNRENGLSTLEAKERLVEYGPNTFERERGPSASRILASQFYNVLTIILLAATVVSGFLGELVDAIVILIIVALVATLGFTQEY